MPNYRNAQYHTNTNEANKTNKLNADVKYF